VREAFLKSIDPSGFIGYYFKYLDFMSNTVIRLGLSAINLGIPNI
jgi:hypothetical protein